MKSLLMKKTYVFLLALLSYTSVFSLEANNTRTINLSQYPANPAQAAQQLSEQTNDPQALTYAALLYFTVPDIRDPEKTDRLMQQAERLINSKDSDYSGFQVNLNPDNINDPNKHYTDLTNLMRDIYQLSVAATQKNNYNFEDTPCWVFEKYPDNAYEGFSSYYGSSLDYMVGFCQNNENFADVTTLNPFFAIVNQALGEEPSNPACSGTSKYARYRNDALNRLKLSLSPKSLKPEDKKEITNTLNSLELWSTRTRGNYLTYHELLKQRDIAKKNLAEHYQKIGLSSEQAKRSADIAIDSYLTTEFDYTGKIAFWDPDPTIKYHPNRVSLYYSELLGNKKYQQIIQGHPVAFTCKAPEQCKQSEEQWLLFNIAIDYGILSGQTLAQLKPYLALRDDWNSYLLLAADRPEVIKYLLEHDKAEINHQDDIGKTALFYAIQAQNIDSVNLLIENGADINIVTFDLEDEGCHALNAFGRTPLMYAYWQGTQAIIDVLLKAGADPFAKDSNGYAVTDYKNI